MKSRLLAMLVLGIAFVHANGNRLDGCNIPVFRYALENWVPDAYHALVVSDGPLTDEEAAWVNQLQLAHQDKQSPANVRVQTVDVASFDFAGENAQEIEDGDVPVWVLKRLEEKLKAAAAQGTQLLVLYPRVWDRFAWQAPFDEASVGRLLDSPARQQVAERLLDGQSAVWVLVEADDAAKNDEAWKRLVSELERIESVVKLPARELIVAEDQFRADVEEAIKLRVEFSAIRLSKSDVAEAAFASMLRQSEPDLNEFADQPIAVPIYGRGRTYFALVGEGINAQTVEGNGHFICGACSCEVKRENPGVDVLLAVDWDAGIGGSAMPDVVLPELTGIGGFEVAPVELAASVASDAVERVASSTPATDTNADTSHGHAALASTQSTPNPMLDTNAAAEASSAQKIEVVETVTPVANVDTVVGESDSPATSAPPTSFSASLLFTLVGGVSLAVCALGFVVFWLDRRP